MNTRKEPAMATTPETFVDALNSAPLLFILSKRPGDIRHTLTVLPALPKLSPLLRREPYPCSRVHRTPPPLARLEGVASIG